MKLRGQAALEIKVGVFVFLLLVLSGVAIFLLGRKSNLFEEQVDLKTSFLSASGLRVGAQVRLAGVLVGQVTAIRFPEDPRDRNVLVDMKVRSEVLPRITSHSKARIDSMGLLGDKVIDISVGVTGTPVEPGAMLVGVAPPEYLSLLDTAHDVLGQIQTVARRVAEVIQLYGDPKIHKDLTETVRGVRNIVKGVETGKGLASAIVFDRDLKERVRRVLSGGREALDRFSEAGRSFASAFGELGTILKRLRTTQGTTAHALLFGKDKVGPILAAAGRAADGLARILAQAEGLVVRAKEGKGLLHTLLSSQEGAEILANLKAASETLRKIVAGVADGQGTLGALLADPTVYEDIKTIVSNLNRNRVLRSLIRYSIQREEELPPPPRTGAK
jgi:phospholipid/cholesterol/gamma-HCH transport system substrate-binding protein